MKDQYFGDIHDYHKYGLLRVLQASGDLSLLVSWLLTPNDDRGDGAQRAYLQQPGRWRHFDPPLFDFLTQVLANDAMPAVAMIERSSTLPRARFFSETVPDERSARARWGDRLLECAAGVDLVFLDPDNGFEIPSMPIGRKKSSKYVAWSEVERLWAAGSSLLVYQHKKMEKTHVTIQRLEAELRRRTGSAHVEVFDSPDVLYFLLARPRHAGIFRQAISDGLSRWSGRIGAVAQPMTRRGDSSMSKHMTRQQLLATAGEAAPVIEALLSLEGEDGICFLPRKRCLSMRVDVDGNEVLMLYIFERDAPPGGVFPCLHVDGKELRVWGGQELLDRVRARLADDNLWRLMRVDAQCSLDHAFSEGEIRAIVGFVRWLRDQICRRKTMPVDDAPQEVTSATSEVWSNHIPAPGTPEGFTVRTTYPTNPDGVEVMLERWQAGTEEPPHSHPGDDMTVVVEGKMSVQFYRKEARTLVPDGERIFLNKGDVGYIRAGRIHEANYIEACQLVYVHNGPFGFHLPDAEVG